MSKLNLGSLMASVAMSAGLAFSSPAFASRLGDPNPADFSIDEEIVPGNPSLQTEPYGLYTVHNNSTDWYIYAFAVTNDFGFSLASTDRPAWSAGSFCTGSFCGDGFNNLGFVQLIGYGFGYQDTSFSPGSNLGNSIGPAQSSAQFRFYAPLRSDWQINVYRGNGSEQATVFGSVGGPVPEPATWALMIGGFGLAGAVLRRRRAQLA